MTQTMHHMSFQMQEGMVMVVELSVDCTDKC